MRPLDKSPSLRCVKEKNDEHVQRSTEVCVGIMPGMNGKGARRAQADQDTPVLEAINLRKVFPLGRAEALWCQRAA